MKVKYRGSFAYIFKDLKKTILNIVKTQSISVNMREKKTDNIIIPTIQLNNKFKKKLYILNLYNLENRIQNSEIKKLKTELAKKKKSTIYIKTTVFGNLKK